MFWYSPRGRPKSGRFRYGHPEHDADQQSAAWKPTQCNMGELILPHPKARTMNPQDLGTLNEMMKEAAAAALAGGIIANLGRPVTLREALDIKQRVRFGMFPAHGYGTYEAWAQDPNRFDKLFE